jgi:hypothetical protein
MLTRRQFVLSLVGLTAGGAVWAYTADPFARQRGGVPPAGPFEAGKRITPVPLHVDGHWIRRADGTAFLVNGDAAWSLVVQLSRPETTRYLEDRAARGVNVVLVNLVEHELSGHSPAWLNAYGHPPFASRLWRGGLDFTDPSEEYWSHVDWVLREAERVGITVIAVPAYVGFGHGSQGWAKEIAANGADGMARYGAWLGARYATQRNLIWCMGGDAAPVTWDASNPLPYDLTDEIDALATAIKAADPNHLMTAHSGRGRSARDDYHRPWLDFDTSYAGDVREEVGASWAGSPPMPTIMVEAVYENEGATDLKLRQQMYQAVLGGAIGHIFGDFPVWRFAEGWEAALNSRGASYLPHVAALQRARDLSALVPDHEHEVVTNGYQDDAAVMVGRRLLVAYSSGGAGLQVDRSRFPAGRYRVRWFNPRNGSTVDAGGTTMGAGSETFDRPDPEDWVLLLDDEALGLPAP